MKKFLATMMMTAGALAATAAVITSPDGAIRLTADVDADGAPCYSVDYKGRALVESSRLGLRADETSFTSGFTIAGVDTATVDRSWQPVWGEY